MSTDFAMYLCKQLLREALLVVSPLILVVMATGLIISLLQAVTQIQDSTLGTIPKMLVTIIMLMVTGEWMLNSLLSFSQNIISHIPENVQ